MLGRCSPTRVRARVVFPEPDSPTSATTSPAAPARSTPSRARAIGPDRVLKSTPTPRASSSGSPVTGSVIPGSFLADPDAGGPAPAPEVQQGRLRLAAGVGHSRAPR